MKPSVDLSFNVILCRFLLLMSKRIRSWIIYRLFLRRNEKITRFGTIAVDSRVKINAFSVGLLIEYDIFGEGSQISTNQERENTVFSLLIGRNLRPFPKNTVLFYPISCKFSEEKHSYLGLQVMIVHCSIIWFSYLSQQLIPLCLHRM